MLPTLPDAGCEIHPCFRIWDAVPVHYELERAEIKQTIHEGEAKGRNILLLHFERPRHVLLRQLRIKLSKIKNQMSNYFFTNHDHMKVVLTFTITPCLSLAPKRNNIPLPLFVLG